MSTGEYNKKQPDPPSIRMLMKRICMAFNGLLSLKTVLNVIRLKAATAVLSWNEMKFWILWKMDLPKKPVSSCGRAIRKKPTFFNCFENGSKIVVHKDDIRGFLGHICTTLSHRNADISHLQSGGIVD